ncbi:bifunctional 3'-5' exonuclease/DNA polymerase, partial [Amycolatopsis magusensis]|nr:bifunctional 3'-5' exonuclease/DNA polymerase [Amycolatopsis magusensis]
MFVADEGEERYSLRERGSAQGVEVDAAELAKRVAELEEQRRPRWVFPAADQVYPVLLRAGVRVARGHDLSLVEGLLLAAEGRSGEPKGLAGAWARL